ncbi:uncharacterized protein V6R79_014408 [Siganus canaliculatus]
MLGRPCDWLSAACRRRDVIAAGEEVFGGEKAEMRCKGITGGSTKGHNTSPGAPIDGKRTFTHGGHKAITRTSHRPCDGNPNLDPARIQTINPGRISHQPHPALWDLSIRTTRSPVLQNEAAEKLVRPEHLGPEW